MTTPRRLLIRKGPPVLAKAFIRDAKKTAFYKAGSPGFCDDHPEFKNVDELFNKLNSDDPSHGTFHAARSWATHANAYAASMGVPVTHRLKYPANFIRRAYWLGNMPITDAEIIRIQNEVRCANRPAAKKRKDDDGSDKVFLGS